MVHKALVVDDDEIILDILEHILEAYGSDTPGPLTEIRLSRY